MRQILLNHYRMCWVYAGVKVTRLKNIFQWKYENWKRSSRGESAGITAETKQKEKTGCQENDSRTATNTHSKLQTPLTNSKNTRKKDLELNTAIQHLTVKLKDETVRPDSLGRCTFFINCWLGFSQKKLQDSFCFKFSCCFFLVWDSRTFKGSEGDLRSPTKYWILYVYYSVYYFIILFSRSWKRGKYIRNSALMGALVFICSCLRVHIVLCIIK